MTFEEHMAHVPTRVRAGAAYMDEQPFRDEWRQKILDRVGGLDMADNCGCVLGITTGAFDEYVNSRRMTFATACSLGFCSPSALDVLTERQINKYFHALEREWMAYVRGEKDPSTIA